MTLTNLFRHISLKRVRLQKAQTFMAVSGICLGVSAIISIGIINKSVLHSFEDSITRVTGRAVLQVTGAQSGFPEALLERVQAVPGVEYAVPVIDTNGILYGGKERSIMILGVDVLQDRAIRDYSLRDESSEIPDPLLFLAKPDSILITREMAAREGIRIDQQIKVETVRGMGTFRVRGLMDPEGPAKVAAGNIAVMDIFAAQMAFGKEGRIDRIDVSILKGEDLNTVQKRIRAALPAGYNVVTPEGRTKQVEVLLATFQRNINIVSFIAVFVGMYLIYNAVSISVVHRRKEIGILRSLGTTRGQIIAMFMGETALIAVAGSLLGIGFGILLAKSLVGVFGQVVSELYQRTSVSEISISGTQLVLGFATGIATSLAAALFPALTSSRITPISAIRSVPYTDEGYFSSRNLAVGAVLFIALSFLLLFLYKAADPGSPLHGSALMFVSILALQLGVSLSAPFFLQQFLHFFHRFLAPRLGAAGRLAGLNLRKNVTRNAVAVAAIFYGISVFVSTAAFISSTRQSIMDWVDAAVRADIIVTAGHPIATSGSQNIPMPIAMMKELEATPGVLAVDPVRRMHIDFRDRRILLNALDVAARLSYSPFLVAQGSREDMVRLLPRQDNLVVNEGLATQFGLKPGDHIELATPHGPLTFGIAAVIVEYSSDSGSLLMDIGTYQKHWGEMLADTFAVRVKNKSELEQVRTAIRDRFGNDRKLFVLSARDFRDEINKIVNQSFVFDYLLNVITMIIACLGIVVTLLASVLERTREIGVLRSLGMLRSQVSKVVVLESALLGVVGGLMGCAGGAVLGWLSMEGFYRADYGASAVFYLPLSAIVWAMIFSIVLSALAGLYPARSAAKTSVLEALAYE
jgi:putative ABC transport system permease protein